MADLLWFVFASCFENVGTPSRGELNEKQRVSHPPRLASSPDRADHHHAGCATIMSFFPPDMLTFRYPSTRAESQEHIRPQRRMLLAYLLPLLLWPSLSICQTQAHTILCHEGYGTFAASLSDGVTVHVGAAREQGLAKRACAATLSSKHQELPVETNADQIDIDAFGVDFGTGAPAAAFQIRKSDKDCCMEYRIYSLKESFHLLRTITGAGFFSASDVDLDGQLEIWASDAAAINGFEGLTLSEIDFPPLVVFRFSHDRLLDVSAEFRPQLDQEIAGIQQQILPADLDDFRNSDGKLAEAVTPASAERSHRLRAVKISALEIIWAYLYSGRDAEAWRCLSELWPAADRDRIRGLLVDARARGLHRQADDTSAGSPPRKKKRVHIFDVDKPFASGPASGIIPPKAIQLDLRPGVGGEPPDHILLDLVIDAAGKVRSAEPAGTVAYPRDWIEMALAWTFVPAFRDGQAVASHLRINVSPKR